MKDWQEKVGMHCKLQISSRNDCAAMIPGKDAFNINDTETMIEAISKVIRKCKSAGELNCHSITLYAVCS